MTAMLQMIKQGDLELKWVAHTRVKRYEESGGFFGTDTPKEELREIHRKYGIHEPGFKLPRDGIELHFKIKTRRGFDYLCTFADVYNYPKPYSRILNIRGAVIKPDELKQAEDKNRETTERVQALVDELAKVTDLSIEDDYMITTLIDTSPFFEWTQEEEFRRTIVLIERDHARMKSIWYDTNILRDC